MEADKSFEVLEARLKDDSSWHPCRVSLSSARDSLVVHFESQEMEDMVLNKEEVLMHLRFRSVPLQADDCSRIEQGERVLANRKSQFEKLFHDAEVEKVDRVRHSKRGCRCTFVIKWLDHSFEGETNSVPASSIMKLATKSISAYPLVNMLIKPEKETGVAYSSPLLAILEGTDAEMDLNKLLQKEIENFSYLSDAYKKDFREDSLLRSKGVNKGQTPQKPTAGSNACVPAVADRHNDFKRTTRSKTKLQVDVEAKDQLCPTITMQEEFTRSRSYLSPLASRAALASALLTAKKRLDMDFDSCMTENMTVKGKDSSDILVISSPLVSEASHAMSPVRSTQGGGSCKPQPTKPSSYVRTTVWDENKTSEEINCNSEHRTFDSAKVPAENVTVGVAHSTAETMTAELAISRATKPSVHANPNASSVAPRRLTRSALRRGAAIQNDCVQVEICSDGTKRRMPGNKNRLDHSALFEGNDDLANEEENSENIVVPESNMDTIKRATLPTAKAAFAPCKATEGGTRNQGLKRKAAHPNNQDRRFSPRNLPPRTRSQNKCQPGKNR